MGVISDLREILGSRDIRDVLVCMLDSLAPIPLRTLRTGSGATPVNDNHSVREKKYSIVFQFQGRSACSVQAEAT